MCPAVASELLLTTELLMRTADEVVHYGAEDLIYIYFLFFAVTIGGSCQGLWLNRMCYCEGLCLGDGSAALK